MLFDPNDPAVLWLNIVNFALAAVVLVCAGVIAAAVMKELALRVRAGAKLTGKAADGHGFAVPDLGYTMADGGEPVQPRRPATGNRPK